MSEGSYLSAVSGRSLSFSRHLVFITWGLLRENCGVVEVGNWLIILCSGCSLNGLFVSETSYLKELFSYSLNGSYNERTTITFVV